eukprot:SAG22_NODE_489_length_9845_cov_5.954550_2_plen_163_part_00
MLGTARHLPRSGLLLKAGGPGRTLLCAASRGRRPITMKSDPRMDPRVTAVFEPFGLADAPEPAPVSPQSPVGEIQAWSVEAEAGFKGLFGAMSADYPDLPAEVENSTEVITGADGNDIKLYISKPKGAEGPLPCVYHTHGGGMALLHASDPNYNYFRDRLAW